MLSGAVKRLRTTNQLKEGMERVIIDQRTVYFPLPVCMFTLMLLVKIPVCPSSVSNSWSIEESSGEFRGEFTSHPTAHF